MIINNSYRHDLCPLCHSKIIHKVGDIQYRQPVTFSTHEITLAHTPELYICHSCGSWFTQNIIPERVAYKMYSEGKSCKKWPKETIFEEIKSANITKTIDKFISPGKKIIDIGCNTGILLDYAKNKGCITTGIEPSKASQYVLRKKGHNVYDSLEEVNETYDVVTAFDLIEHLYDITSFINNALKLMTDNGVLILLTGDITSISANLAKSDWWYLKAPEHIAFPSINFISKMDGIKIRSTHSTYASIGYKRPLHSIAYIYLKNLFRGKKYDGLPPLGPDHILLVCEKNISCK